MHLHVKNMHHACMCASPCLDLCCIPSSFGILLQNIFGPFADTCINFVPCIMGLQELKEKIYLLTQSCGLLSLKAPITTAADDIHKYFFTVFQRK